MEKEKEAKTGRGPDAAPVAGVWRSRISVGCFIAGLLIAGLILKTGFSKKRTRFDELALGVETTSYFSKLDGIPIHCKAVPDALECLAGAKKRALPRAALWLGNSQLHAINQIKAGDENAPPILARKLRPRGLDLVAFSQPNASLQEHYVLFEYLRRRLALRWVILPLVCDDLRETGLRETVQQALKDTQVEQALRSSAEGRHLVQIAEAGANKSSSDTAALDQTVQEHAEKALNAWLERHSSVWAARVQVRGKLFEALYKLRNSVFGISAQSARPMIRSRYEANLGALKALLRAAKSGGVGVIAYVAPLRSDVKTPYVVAEYKKFKREAKQLCEAGGAVFANLEDLVPSEYWGSKASTSVGKKVELDFMHFQAPGHKLLADRVGALLDRSGARPK